MGKYVTCPFCGEHGERTDEHVWAQWMRDREGARALLDGATGERINLEPAGVEVSADGRFQQLNLPSRRTAALLPHVKVPVCATCNGGWMSRLEDAVKSLLTGYRAAGFPTRLGPDEQTLLATWATKSWMAYAPLSGVDSLHNPFSEAEYRAMAADPRPLERTRIMLFHSTSPYAHVGMGVSGTLFGRGPTAPDLVNDRDNGGFAYLAADGIVMFAVIAPDDSPNTTLMRDLAMLPPEAFADGIVRIQPPRDVFAFPTETVDDGLVDHFISWPEEFAEHMSLPVIGLMADDADDVQRAFLDGADPQDLRRRWDQTTTPRTPDPPR